MVLVPFPGALYFCRKTNLFTGRKNVLVPFPGALYFYKDWQFRRFRKDCSRPLLGVSLFLLVLCQDLVQVKMSFSHSNLPAIPKLPVDTILQNHRVTYNRNDYEFVWYYKTFPSIQIPGGMHVCNC